MCHSKKWNKPPLPPLTLVYQDTKSPEEEMPDHLHERYELIYVYSGKGTFFIDNKFYKMDPGSVFIIPPNTIHRALPDKIKPVTSTVLYFEPLIAKDASFDDTFSFYRTLEVWGSEKEYKMSLDFYQQKHMDFFLKHIQNEFEWKTTGFKTALIHWLCIILLTLHRWVQQTDYELVPSIEKGPKWMHDILNYIDHHLGSKTLTLSHLANEACVSPEHFSRVFRNMTGINVTDYLLTKKVIKAKELLRNTDENIALIAEQSGFYSMPYFYRIFKKYVKKTPNAYRNGD